MTSTLRTSFPSTTAATPTRYTAPRTTAYYATDGHCTHEQTLLCDGLVMGGVIECPKHNGRFDYASGKALGAPVLVDLRTYPTKVMDGTVYIEVG